MAIPGYDLDDVDARLAELLEEADRREYLTDEERRRNEAGESPSDVLDGERIAELLDRVESEREESASTPD
jgi:hypothetical protein